jgi:formate hydrogenlyase transcriptional activator
MNKRIDSVPPVVLTALELHDWPGNVGELENLVGRAVILSSRPILRPALTELHQLPAERSPLIVRTLEEVEREHIRETLREAKGVIGGRNGAAAKLGLPRRFSFTECASWESKPLILAHGEFAGAGFPRT